MLNLKGSMKKMEPAIMGVELLETATSREISLSVLILPVLLVKRAKLVILAMLSETLKLIIQKCQLIRDGKYIAVGWKTIYSKF
jgi:hypothetical protein